jgi:hypothetical protein
MPKAAQLKAGGRVTNERDHRIASKGMLPGRGASTSPCSKALLGMLTADTPPECILFNMVAGGHPRSSDDTPATSFDASGIGKDPRRESFNCKKWSHATVPHRRVGKSRHPLPLRGTAARTQPLRFARAAATVQGRRTVEQRPKVKFASSSALAPRSGDVQIAGAGLSARSPRDGDEFWQSL